MGLTKFLKRYIVFLQRTESEVRKMEKLLKKLTAYCDRGRREQNIVSFIAGSIVSTILIIVQLIARFSN